jgi:flagellar motor switch/type III secretory pathway protein FliN
MRLRDGLIQVLASLTNPLPLAGLAPRGNRTDCHMQLQGVGTGVPLFPENFIAIAMVSPRSTGRIVVVLTRNTAVNLVTLALGRPAPPDIDVFHTFDQGVLLRVAAMVAADFVAPEACQIEIRGLLDTPAQLRLFFANRPFSLWHVKASLCMNGSTTPCTIIGNGAIEMPGTPFFQPGWTARADSDDTLDIPAILRVEIGRTTLGAAALEAMAPGDVITLDSLCVPPCRTPHAATEFEIKNEMVLRSGYFTWTASWLDTSTLQLKDNSDMTGTSDDTLQINPPRTAPVEEIDIPCTVELGELHMTVKDLSTLMPGQILRLNRPVSDTVYLKAGNRLLCKGQLVTVADELALEITEIP